MLARRRARSSAAAAAAACALALAGCDGAPEQGPSPSSSGLAIPTLAPGAAVASPPPPPALAWGPSQEQWDRAQALARAMTLDEVAGQVIMADISSPDPRAAQALIEDVHVGGLIVMGSAVESASDIREVVDAATGAAADRSWPLLIAADQEGGIVARLSRVAEDVPSFMAAGAADDAEATTAAYTGVAAEMRALGFTVDFAPVADVTIGPADPTIRVRAASDDPERAARAVLAAAEGLVAGGVVPAVKHFPGHGSLTVDSHEALPHQSASVASLAQRDLVPFAEAIDAGVPMVMMGHIAVEDWGTRAATINPKAYAYLRDELAFDGVAVTDAMTMKAITDEYPDGRAAVEALKAGADLVLMPANPAAAHREIVSAATSGELSRARLDEAAARTIALAWWQAGLPPSDVVTGYAEEFSERAAVVAARTCGRLVGAKVTIIGGGDRDRERLADALRTYGVAVGAGGTSVELLPYDRSSASADVVVALQGPWGLPASRADAYVAVWGDGPEQMAALATVLVGEASALGSWPVALDLPYPACR